jgi:Chs5-Arf1p-binding protein BUD7/BCH1
MKNVIGWQLGSDSIVQVPNNVSNHLTSGLLKYFHTTGRFTSAINLFEKLRSQNVEVSSLLAKILFMGNEEVQGVQALYQALKETPMDYVMLDTQAEFLMKKAMTAESPEQKEEILKMALGCADRSTIAAPSEFGTWARLAQIYVALEDWENALTILNSCPMFTYQDKDAPIMPEPKEVYLPTLPETRLDEIDSEPESRFSEQVDPSLLNLRAASYRGTFKLAYNILTEMTAKIGWDQLLKIRSSVFVMEDEYRSDRHDDASQAQAKRNPSTDGLRGSPEPSTNGDQASDRIDDGEKSTTDAAASTRTASDSNGTGEETVEKPTHTIDPGEVKADGDNVRLSISAAE